MTDNSVRASLVKTARPMKAKVLKTKCEACVPDANMESQKEDSSSKAT